MIYGQAENKELIIKAIELNVPCLLIGETGTGKTSIIRELASEYGHKLTRINLTGQTSTDDFIGKWLIKDNETVWVDGVLTKAMRDGDYLVADELNACVPDILFALHSLLDDSRSIMLSEKNGEIVKPHKDFRFFATMNPSAEYAGTKELNKAFMSRFAMILYFDYPSPINETKAVGGTVDAKLMVDYANRLRQLKAEDKITYAISTRDLIQWHELSKVTDFETAFKATVLNKADKNEQATLLQVYNSMFAPIKERASKYSCKYYSELIKKLDDKERELIELEKRLTELKTTIDNNKADILKDLIEFQATDKVKRL